MTESFILDYIPKRLQQLGYQNWHMEYRDLAMQPEYEIEIPAYNEIWFLVGNPNGFYVESDYGIYDGSQVAMYEYSHEHRGEILIRNTSNMKLRITFIQIIIIN